MNSQPGENDDEQSSNGRSKRQFNGTPFISTRLKIIAIAAASIIFAVTASWTIHSIYVDSLLDRAKTMSHTVTSTEISFLSFLDLADDETPYTEIKDRLTSLKDVYSDTRFVYIMAEIDGKTVFLADSEPSDSDDYSPRGEEYTDATPLLKSVFESGNASAEGPVRDEYGIWYSAMAPIKNNEGTTIALIGIDVPAENYLLSTIGVGVGTIIFALLACIAIYFYDRSRDRRLAALKLQMELMSVASHELRSPLSGIRWGEEVLLKAELGEAERTVATAIYDSTLRLQDSIEEVLQIAAIGSNKSHKTPWVGVDLAGMIDECVRFQQLAAQQKEISFVYDNSWSSPIMTIGDSTQLRRVFNNVISNAVKYASVDTDITISYSDRGDSHLIVIKNQGIGVPHKELEHIFDGFYRASNAVRYQVNGTGMGLFLSRNTIEHHGGKMWLESVENESTTVYIQMPIVEVSPEAQLPNHDEDPKWHTNK